MKRILLILCVVVLLASPIFFVILRNPLVSTQLRRTLGFPLRTQISKQYEVVNKSRETKLALVDTGYLDFVVANMGILKENAIVDPQFYRGNTKATQKHTVSRVQFLLVDDMDTFVYAAPGEKEFASKGTYTLDNDTLIVQIALYPSEIAINTFNTQYALEEVFLKTAFTTLLYAHGLADPRKTAETLAKIKSDMKEYLESGVFAWPIAIEEI